ncbi:hypothetical protein D3C81_1974400 [compost metagenome]
MADWRKDGKLIFDIIFEQPEYQQLEIDFKKHGWGATGLGVLDVQANIFYDCGFTNHWPTIQRIIEETYPQYHEPVRLMYLYEKLMEHDGVTREEVENFIMTNFELYGGTKPLQEYL